MTIRDYFETPPAKGPQNGSGADLKYKSDKGVIKRQVYPYITYVKFYV